MPACGFGGVGIAVLARPGISLNTALIISLSGVF